MYWYVLKVMLYLMNLLKMLAGKLHVEFVYHMSYKVQQITACHMFVDVRLNREQSIQVNLMMNFPVLVQRKRWKIPREGKRGRQARLERVE